MAKGIADRLKALSWKASAISEENIELRIRFDEIPTPEVSLEVCYSEDVSEGPVFASSLSEAISLADQKVCERWEEHLHEAQRKAAELQDILETKV
jgi:hypothetical protein